MTQRSGCYHFGSKTTLQIAFKASLRRDHSVSSNDWQTSWEKSILDRR